MSKPAIWVHGDYRDYFHNRVSLQLIAGARALAEEMDAQVGVVVIGHQVDEWVAEYQAHGAQLVHVVEHPGLADYLPGVHARILEELARRHQPEIILVGATAFGRELAARTASRLGTGLTADCVALGLDENRRLIMTAPAYGGNLLAEIVIPRHKPQMATVRPGVFTELAHDGAARAEVIHEKLAGPLPSDGVRLKKVERQAYQGQDLERASVVVCGGRGLKSAERFQDLGRLAEALGGEVGATRPVVYAGWAPEEALVGQAGKQISPRVLFSLGVSGAIQHTAGIGAPEFTVAVNTNPRAMMMQRAEVGLCADAHQVCRELLKMLEGARRD